MALSLRFVGCGDAFGTGGRAHTCFHLTDGVRQVLVDCGASAVPALKRHHIAAADLDLIVLSHLHGDHFGGVPFLLLDATFGVPRTRPLTIVGPPGTEARVVDTIELLFPGAAARVRERVSPRFIEYPVGRLSRLRLDDRGVEIEPVQARRWWQGREARISSTDAMDLLAVEVVHPSGAPSCALRLEWQQRVFAYSGDTAWTEALITVANGADLFVCECYAYDKAVPFHLNYCTMVERLADLAPRRIILTHLGTDMLAHRSRVSLECAEDGQLVTF
ncbi:MAG: MBL fold metallo-hydrolase [Vicinamibacterales bacterium]